LKSIENYKNLLEAEK
jgi:hypothetical protein